MNNKLLKTVFSPEKIITWGLPTILIPSIRYLQDNDKPSNLRKELFTRDFSSFAIGSGLYFSVTAGIAKLLKNPEIKNTSKKPPKFLIKHAPVLSGVTAYCIWSGLLAPKLSKLMYKAKQSSSIQKPKLNIKEDTSTTFRAKDYKSNVLSRDTINNTKIKLNTFKQFYPLNTYKNNQLSV